ncbi:hypothetical protein BOTU111922_01840 [Bordetella tumulicola]
MATLSHLFIDKVSATLQVQTDPLQHAVTERLQTCAECEYIIQVLSGPLLQNYHFAYTLPLAGGRHLTIQAVPRFDRMNFIRLEFNPKVRGQNGEHPVDLIGNVLCPSWPNFFGDLEHARFTRLDFAVDIRGVHIEQLGLYHSTRSVFSRKFEAQFDRGGQTTGIYLGKRTSNRYIVAYDKRREFIEKQGKRPRLRGAWTRIECRHADLGNLRTIFDMPNPLLSFTLTRYPSQQLDETSALFLDSCRYRGAQAALYRIKNRRTRTRYRAWLSELSPPWWNPHDIWEQRGEALANALGCALGTNPH